MSHVHAHVDTHLRDFTRAVIVSSGFWRGGRSQGVDLSVYLFLSTRAASGTEVGRGTSAGTNGSVGVLPPRDRVQRPLL